MLVREAVDNLEAIKVQDLLLERWMETLRSADEKAMLQRNQDSPQAMIDILKSIIIISRLEYEIHMRKAKCVEDKQRNRELRLKYTLQYKNDQLVDHDKDYCRRLLYFYYQHHKQ